MATLVFVGVDQFPRSSMQTVVLSIGMILGAVINANIFGELTMIMSSLDKATKLYQQRYDQNQTAMLNLKLPLEFQFKVLNAMVL